MSGRERMSAVDAAWLHMDRPTNLLVINAVSWFDEPLDWDLVAKLIQTRWVEPYRRFRQRVGEGLPLVGPQWEDDPRFALENHLHHVALPAPGGRAALQDFVGDMMSVPIDRTKPLWHMYLIDGYGQGCALLIRVHHAVADGIALAQVFQQLTDSDAHEVRPGTAVARVRERRDRGLVDTLTAPAQSVMGNGRRAAGTLLRDGIGMVAHPSRVVSAAMTGRDDAAALAKSLLTPADIRTAITGDTVVAKRAVWSEPLPLADVKAIGKATGTTVNDVLLSAVTGALRRYLQDHGDIVDNVRTFVPYNLRPLDRPVPSSLGNRFGLIFLDLPVGLDSARARLAELSQRMEKIKNSPEGAMSFGLLAGMGKTPGSVEKAIIDFFTAKASAVMTNVPGPRAPLYLAGVPLAGVISWVPRSGDTPLGVCIFTYAGSVYIGIAVDSALIPEPQQIVTAFEAELAELRRVAQPGAG